MKKYFLTTVAVFVSFSLLLPSVWGQDNDSNQTEKQSNTDFSGYMKTINELQDTVNEKLPAYQEAMKKIFPTKELDGNTVILYTYEKKFTGSFTPYFIREYVMFEGGAIKIFSEKTVSDVILDAGKPLEIEAGSNQQTDGSSDVKTTPHTRQREIALATDADSINIIYRSTFGSKLEQKLGELKKLRSQIDILNQIREQLIVTERVMDYTIHRAKILKEDLNEESLVNFQEYQ